MVDREPVAFMSYTHFDDQHDGQRLTQFRTRLAAEVRAQTGARFEIFQDRNDIQWGENWQQRINKSLDTVTLLIPFLTPNFFQSSACREEVTLFLERERDLGRTDLILPVYYIDYPPFNDDAQRSSDEVAQAIHNHQFTDWRQWRHTSLNSVGARKRTEQLALQIRNALVRTPEERLGSSLLRNKVVQALNGVGVSLETLLAAIQGLGGNDDLASVTATLAKAATRLTSFRACNVYLYESRDGVFVPYAGQPDGLRDGTVVSRSRAEALMSARFRRGYSYYVPRAGHDNVETTWNPVAAATEPVPWREGDSLVAPLLLKNGDVIGYIELDRPADQRVPTVADLAPLETLAFLTASIIARLRHTDEVLHLAASDGLTGLLNRRAFKEHLHRELSGAARRKRPLTLMMIDIDDFGSVNNTFGHQVGDDALRLVSGVIRAHLRESDAGGRYGGDEFTVVLPDLDAAHAADIAERLRAALAIETCRAAAEGSLPQIYTSIGVASFPAHADDAGALIKAADDALYESKRMGKNCVSVK